ncbi:Pheromone-binding protein-related protein 1 [Melipona quadrifasciata]|uniref:Pheromone-binding protein-related protein 1 n=1 Tax=Melipona quadrifasciata TaxID=166423 RepID=A0A0M8ZNT6_9HYME|nr:Pheromone-binding protein-related protein 1 [Melipona quadrifasciata]
MDLDEIKAMLTKFRKKCMDETKANLEMIENTDFGVFPEDESLKCYFKCVFEKFHMMDKDGKIKYNLLKKVIPDAYQEIGNEMIDSCTHIDSEDKCEKTFMFMKCMYNVNPWVSRVKSTVLRIECRDRGRLFTKERFLLPFSRHILRRSRRKITMCESFERTS